MKGVKAYEHKGFQIREGSSSISEIIKLYQKETDIWLKKLCAKRLLEQESFEDLAIDKKELKELMQCQIDL